MQEVEMGGNESPPFFPCCKYKKFFLCLYNAFRPDVRPSMLDSEGFCVCLCKYKMFVCSFVYFLVPEVFD